jgi:hypothetical protein
VQSQSLFIPRGSSVTTSSSAVSAKVSSGFVRLDPEALSGKSVDGAYSLRSLHDARIKAHIATSLSTPNGTVTQVEYSTPYGPLTLIQSAKSINETATIAHAKNTRSPANQAPQAAAPALATGVTSHGASWITTSGPNPQVQQVHIEFSDSSIDGQAPISLSASKIGAILEEIY